MEERIIDKDDARKIRVKRDGEGGIRDAEDELAPENTEETEEEYLLDLPEGEYDEDLVGLSPSELEQELEKRRKEAEEAAAERDKLLALARSALTKGDYAAAEPLFAQALLYDPESKEAGEGLWTARTRNFSDLDVLLGEEAEEDFSRANDAAKAFVRERVRAPFMEQRKEAEDRAAPLREKVDAAREERRGAFRANRSYYVLRLSLLLAALGLMLIAAAVSASYIVRTLSILPVVLTAVFGALSVILLVPIVLLARKVVVAQRLCRENERLSSTEDGAALEALEEKLQALSLYLGDE